MWCRCRVPAPTTQVFNASDFTSWSMHQPLSYQTNQPHFGEMPRFNTQSYHTNTLSYQTNQPHFGEMPRFNM